MINYVIAAWAGNRRRKDPQYNDDRSYYLSKHLLQIQDLKHSLGQITIVINEDAEKHPEFDSYVEMIPESIGGVPVTILRRPNIGMSYGCWAHAYEKYRGKFRYYIIMEDDYVPCLNNFDSILIDYAEARGIDYLCGYYTDHAAVSGGVMRSDSLSRIYAWGKGLPYYKSAGGAYGPNQEHGQIAISKAFTDIGLVVGDYTDRYLTVFETSGPPYDKYIFVGDKSDKPIIVPINYLEEMLK